MSERKIISLLFVAFLIAISYSCNTIPDGAVAVTPFDKSRYLGKWYEIARLDFKYEKDLNNVTAEYSLNKNGSIRVKNRGYNTKKREWKDAIGKAKFVKKDTIAMLKVSFFGPFYSGYNVLAIDDQYRYALVAGESLKYLWILSRDTAIPDEVRNNYLEIAEKVGYKTSDLLWVEHNGKQ